MPSAEAYTPAHAEDLFDAARQLAPQGYFCHFTAIRYHGLTTQVPATLYVCKESIGKAPRKRPEKLTDLQIRSSFIKPPRRTTQIYQHPEGKVILIAREQGTDAGVDSIPPQESSAYPNGSRITSLERCLIDAVVAPHYNGGITSLPGIFEEAADQLNLHVLNKYYRKLNFLYPYHQTIGFLLDNSGQKNAAAQWWKLFPPNNRFFVDKAAKSSWPYDPKWQVHYPRGLVDAN